MISGKANEKADAARTHISARAGNINVNEFSFSRLQFITIPYAHFYERFFIACLNHII